MHTYSVQDFGFSNPIILSLSLLSSFLVVLIRLFKYKLLLHTEGGNLK